MANYRPMRCIKCRSDQIKTISTRSHDSYIRRRRECISCGHRFTTYEVEAEVLRQLIAIEAKKLKETENDDV